MSARPARHPDGVACARESIASVAVIGADAAGASIAMRYLDAGIPVTLMESRREALLGGVALIRKTYESLVQQRKLADYKYAVRMAFLSTTMNLADTEAADLVIDAHAQDGAAHLHA